MHGVKLGHWAPVQLHRDESPRKARHIAGLHSSTSGREDGIHEGLQGFPSVHGNPESSLPHVHCEPQLPHAQRRVQMALGHVDDEPCLEEIISYLEAKDLAGLPSLFGEKDIIQVRENVEPSPPPIHK